MTFLPDYYQGIYGPMNNPDNLHALGGLSGTTAIGVPSSKPSAQQIIALVMCSAVVIGGTWYLIKKGKK